MSSSSKPNHHDFSISSLNGTTVAAIAASTVAVFTMAVLFHAKRFNTLFRRYVTVKDLPNLIITNNNNNNNKLRSPLRLTGYAVSVGDSDGFRFFHTPTLRWYPSSSLPQSRLSDCTIPIRLAGTDCPEGAHFGMDAQPWSYEAYQFTLSCLMPGSSIKPGSTKFIRGKQQRSRSNHFFSRSSILSSTTNVTDNISRGGAAIGGQPSLVRIEIYRIDQYNRVVAMVWYRPYPRLLPFYWRNLSLDLLSKGLGVIYTQAGAEYGGLINLFEKAQNKAKRHKIGIWSQKTFISPAEHKKNRPSDDN